MKQGIYEQLINTITRHEISALDPDVYNIGTEKLDAEEARKLLSTYLAAVTRRALKIVREQTEDKTAVLAQIRTCNEIIATLKGTLGEEEYNELQLDEQGEVLTHVYSKLNSIRAVENKHSDLGGSSGGKRHSGEIKSFDPNYQQALAWERLMKGSYNKNDILLLNHELFNIREVEH